MDHDNYEMSSRFVGEWARLMEVATHRFDAMLERLGWFEDAFDTTDAPGSDPETKVLSLRQFQSQRRDVS
ncbi:MAG: hypothetical protein ABW110_08365 [Steroidobacteraceae bacterium]